MTRVLLLGYDPEFLDFSDPAFPPGMTAEKVHAGIAVAMKQFAEHGWEGDLCLIRPDETAGPDVERHLASKGCDCVVIGAGVRLPPWGIALFETVINAVLVGLPQERRLPSIPGPMIAPMPPRDGWRLGAGPYSPAFLPGEILQLADQWALPDAEQQLFELSEILGPKLSAPFMLDVAENVVDLRVGGVSAFGEVDKARAALVRCVGPDDIADPFEAPE